MAQVGGEDPKARLEKIKKQLNAGAGSVLLHGPLLKRSETLRKWNQRWFSLDPSTGKMEYRFQRGDPSPRGLIHFDADSTITVSPLNIQGDRKYDGCCFYIGTAQKKESFLCAETPAAARAWVASLRAAALVLKAHKDAVNSLSGNGNAKLGTVAASVAAANATAQEAMKDIQVSFRPSVAAAPQTSTPAANVGNDNSTILKETLRVKDEELNQLQRDLRARDLTIKELADRLSETADAAESAAKAVHFVDKDRQVALTEVEHLKKELLRASEQIKAAEERVVAANKTRDLALQEAHRWRVELGKAREQCVIWEGAVQRGHEHARQLKKAHEQELATLAQSQQPRPAATEVNAQVQDERRSTAETVAKDAHEQELASLAQSQQPRPASTEVNAKVEDERPSTAETVAKDAHEQELASLAQSQQPRPAATEVNARVQDERPSTAETVANDSSNVTITEPHVVSSPGAPETENVEGTHLPSENTNATPQAASSDPETAENMLINLPEEIAHTPPHIPLISKNITPEVFPHAPPPSEQHGLSQDGAEQQQSAEQAKGPPVEAAATSLASSQADQEAASPHTGEFPMNESGA